MQGVEPSHMLPQSAILKPKPLMQCLDQNLVRWCELVMIKVRIAVRAVRIVEVKVDEFDMGGERGERYNGAEEGPKGPISVG